MIYDKWSKINMNILMVKTNAKKNIYKILI